MTRRPLIEWLNLRKYESLLDRIEALEARPTVSSEAAAKAERLVPIGARWTGKLSHAERPKSQTEPDRNEAPGQVAATADRRDERPADCAAGEVENDEAMSIDNCIDDLERRVLGAIQFAAGPWIRVDSGERPEPFERVLMGGPGWSDYGYTDPDGVWWHDNMRRYSVEAREPTHFARIRPPEER